MYEYLFKVLSKDTELKKRIVITDPSYVKVHAHSTGTKNGIKSDCKVSFALIKNIRIDILVNDRAYDTNDIVEYAKSNGIEIVILPNRKLKRNFGDFLYPCHRIIENIFLTFKR